MSTLQTNPSNAASTIRDEVYIATMPLRAAKGAPQFLLKAAFALNVRPLQHFMLIIKPSSPVSPDPTSKGLVFDFQPQDPEDIFVALAALSGKPVPGTILTRKIRRLPNKKCWYVGLSNSDDAIEAAYKFNSSWPTDLRIGDHDCRHYTNGLAEVLTGEKDVLKRLTMDYTS